MVPPPEFTLLFAASAHHRDWIPHPQRESHEITEERSPRLAPLRCSWCVTSSWRYRKRKSLLVGCSVWKRLSRATAAERRVSRFDHGRGAQRAAVSLVPGRMLNGNSGRCAHLLSAKPSVLHGESATAVFRCVLPCLNTPYWLQSERTAAVHDLLRVFCLKNVSMLQC